MRPTSSLDQVQAVIFDMDGVLVDSEPIHVEAERAACRAFGINAPMSEWEKFKGMRARDIFAYLIKHYASREISPLDMDRYKTDIYLTIAPQRLTMLTGAMDFLRALKNQAYTLALTTSAKAHIQQLVFTLFDLKDIFKVVVTGDDIKNGKPHPEPFLITARELGLAPQDCLVIEDSVHGIVSAKQAGCLAYGLTTSFSRERLQAAGADQVAESFDELSRCFFIQGGAKNCLHGHKITV